MTRIPIIGALLAVCILIPATLHAWPGHTGDRPHPLEGAWRLVGTLAENDDVVVPNAPGFEEYKVVADGYFMWTSLQDGRILGHAGGVARMGRATYTERVDYASEPQLQWIVGQRHLFNWKIVDGRWYHVGSVHDAEGHRARVAEVWERVR